MSNPYQPPQQPQYPQQPGPQPYQQPYQQQPYQQQPQYGGYAQPQGYPGSPVPAPRKPAGITGVLGLGMVLVAFAVGLVMSILSVPVVISGLMAASSASSRSGTPDFSAMFGAASGYGIVYLVSCLLGTVGWVLSIVGTVKGSFRPAAISGIVLGVLAIPIHYIVFVALLAQQAQRLYG